METENNNGREPVGPNSNVRDALLCIHDTFKRDMDAGFKTRDKEFAVAVAAEALSRQQATPVGPTDSAHFKNFHRSLCARFGYTHDEQYWWRDLVSFEEHIAAQLAAPQPQAAVSPSDLSALPPEQIADLASRCGIKGSAAALAEFAALVREAEPLDPDEIRPKVAPVGANAIAEKLRDAVDRACPVPDNPHASVIQRANDERAAMWRGAKLAMGILATPVSPSDLSALHLAALAAAQQWANAEYMHARNLGKGGPGVGDQCDKAEAAAKAAIDRLAAAQQQQQPPPVGTDDYMVYGRAGNRRVDLEATLRDALAGKVAAPALTREQFEEIAQGWDGCSYDDGMILDIGAALRRDFDRLAAAPAASPVAPEQAAPVAQAFLAAELPAAEPVYRVSDIATPAASAPTVPSAWMSDNRKECTTAASKKWMENAGFGHWAEIAARYTIPLYEHAATPAASAPTVPEDWREVAEALEESYAADSSLDFMDRAAKIIRSAVAPSASADAVIEARELALEEAAACCESAELLFDVDELMNSSKKELTAITAKKRSITIRRKRDASR